MLGSFFALGAVLIQKFAIGAAIDFVLRCSVVGALANGADHRELEAITFFCHSVS